MAKNSLSDITALWPEQHLQRLGHCPVCQGSLAEVLHNNLQDRIFFCAPGSWTMLSCQDCGCAYLDPRPDEASIGLAYSEYYTHDINESWLSDASFWAQRLPSWRSGYIKRRFPAYAGQPANLLGGQLLARNATARALLERDVRHLPTPLTDARLVDIGCGSGSFVRRAQLLGYQAQGLEFDPQAVEQAQRQHINVTQGALPDTGLPSDHFDAVSLSHVIEHLHQPVRALHEINRILKPGGFFWLSTPNALATGHRRFGVYWRGLEPPRHLALFSAKALQSSLQEAGFGDIRFQCPGPVSAWFYRASQEIAATEADTAGRSLDKAALSSEIRTIDRLSMSDPCAGEELIVTARRV